MLGTQNGPHWSELKVMVRLHFSKGSWAESASLPIPASGSLRDIYSAYHSESASTSPGPQQVHAQPQSCLNALLCLPRGSQKGRAQDYRKDVGVKESEDSRTRKLCPGEVGT